MIERSKSPRYYFDLRKAKKAMEKIDTPFTPAIGLVIALGESLKRIRKVGLQNFFDHHARLARATRQAAKALGLTLFPHDSCLSNVLTAINVPEGMDGGQLVKRMRDTYGVTIAGGQSELKGKIVRIAHMGCIEESDILTALSCFEKVLSEMGYRFTGEAGIKAAQEIFSQAHVS